MVTITVAIKNLNFLAEIYRKTCRKVFSLMFILHILQSNFHLNATNNTKRNFFDSFLNNSFSISLDVCF